LPLYIDFFNSLPHIELKIVWVIRHPESVAQSLFERDKFNRYKTDFLYTRYSIDTFKSLVNCDHIKVEYESATSHPKKVEEQIIDYLSVDNSKEMHLEDLILPRTRPNTLEELNQKYDGEFSLNLYNCLVKPLSDHEKSEKIELLNDRIQRETKIVDSWTQKKYHSRLVAQNQESLKFTLDTYIATSGWNVVQWRNDDKIDINSIELIAFSDLACYEFSEVLLNGEEVEWETRSMINSGDRYYSNSKYASLLINVSGRVDSVFIKYYVETLEVENLDIEAIALNTNQLKQLKNEVEIIQHNERAEKNKLEIRLQQLLVDKSGQINERQDDYIRYQQSLQSLIENYSLKLESYKKSSSDIDYVVDNISTLVNINSDKNVKLNKLDDKVAKLNELMENMSSAYSRETG